MFDDALDPCLTESENFLIEKPNTPHAIIYSLIKSNTTILDVGCNSGLLGKDLLKKNVISDGIDINKKAIAIAKKYYRNVYYRDLSKGQLKIENKKYNYIVFADVLEHLARPDILLKNSRRNLKKNGHIIVSLPNIARFEVRIELLFGKFKYQRNGILSSDHLRFFTRESAIQLLHMAGYEIEEIIPTGLGKTLNIFTSLTAFQFVFVCKKS